MAARPSVVVSPASSEGCRQCHSASSSLSDRLAREPARGERQDDEMALDLAGGVAGDRLAIAGKPDRLDLERGLLLHFADDRFLQRLAEFDHAAGQGVDAVGGRARAPHDQHPAVADDRGAHGEKWTRRISARVGAVGHRWALLFG